MDKALKEKQISFVKDLVENSECMVLAGIEGLSAGEVSGLRRDLHDANVGFRVVKNKLARIAIGESAAKELNDDFVGSTAIAWSDDNPVMPAKILVKAAKDIEKLKIKAGFNCEKRLDAEGIKALSMLPSLDELRAQILGLFTSSASRLLAQVNAPASHLVGVLQARVDKEEGK